MSSSLPEKRQDDRLMGWKEIAACLHISERTAQRWERLGLPVRRISTAKCVVVHASRTAIESWLDSAAGVEALEEYRNSKGSGRSDTPRAGGADLGDAEVQPEALLDEPGLIPDGVSGQATEAALELLSAEGVNSTTPKRWYGWSAPSLWFAAAGLVIVMVVGVSHW